MKNIKIVYSWIGPYGAIPNEDVPNVLNFASVSGATIHSNKFFAEDIWTRLFFNDDNFQLSPVYGIKEYDNFIYPFNLRWRVRFPDNFINTNGMIEWASVPKHITHYVKEKNGYFLIDGSFEAFIEPNHLWAMHSYFNSLNIPLSKIIYLTGCMNALQLYDEFLKSNNLSVNNKDKIIMITYPRSYLHYNPPSSNNQLANYNIHSLPEKLFLSWNRRFRPHRIALSLLLEKENLIDKSFVSLNRVSDENSSQKFEDCIPYNCNVSPDIIQRLVSKLPLVLDGETSEENMCNDITGKTSIFYRKSLVSIVTETNFFTKEITLTEKAFKPIRFMHPFIFAGVPGTLKELRNIGFKTFNEFWNEDYDLIEDHYKRLEAIVEICKDIASWNEQQILDFKKNVFPILQHNLNNLKNKYSERVKEQIFNRTKNMTDEKITKKIVVLGAGGFIGSHLVKRLKSKGHTVIGADLKHSEYIENFCDQFLIADLRNRADVDRVIDNDVDEIYQLAADMGGAGYIFTGNHDGSIMHNSSLININVLSVMQQKNIKKVFYSSSACVYPEYNQNDPSAPLCTEDSVYPAAPDSDYGWEKLFSERLYASFGKENQIDVRIARFHNIFGPYGSWNNGKEKAPAAICRKVALAEQNGIVEVWGDGNQTRSFLYIEDALDGIEKIMEGNYDKPINLGSERMISINELVKVVAMIAGKNLSISNISGPTGVRGRNSDNKLILKELNWAPPDNLIVGLNDTYKWINSLVKLQS